VVAVTGVKSDVRQGGAEGRVVGVVSDILVGQLR
jgi:hypothetical protein